MNKLFETLKMKAAKCDEITMDELKEMVSDPELKEVLAYYEFLGYSLDCDVLMLEDDGEIYIHMYAYSGGPDHKVTVTEDNAQNAINEAALILLNEMYSDEESIVDNFSGEIYGEEIEEDGVTLFVYDRIESIYRGDVFEILNLHRADLGYDPDELEVVERDGVYRLQRVIA